MLKLECVSVRRGASLVLRDVTLQIPAGRLTAIVGPSGAGKSTLVNVLNGLIAPIAGSVTHSELGALETSSAMKRHRSRTATIFQDHALIDRLTVLENVLLGFADTRHPLTLRPWPRESRRRAAEALDSVGLLHLAQSRVAKLSGGERQRVGVARALARRPTLLLGDEPFSSVDPILVQQLGEMLRDAIAVSGTTIVIVVHQLEAVSRFADWVIGLAEGQVAFSGTVEDFDSAAQSRVFQRRERPRKTLAPEEDSQCLSVQI